MLKIALNLIELLSFSALTFAFAASASTNAASSLQRCWATPSSMFSPSSRTVARRRARADSATSTSLFCVRSEEHTSELQSLMRISYAVYCLKKKNTSNDIENLFIESKSQQ